MSTGNQGKTRSDRVSSVQLPPGRIARMIEYLRRRDVLMRLTLCFVAIGVLCVVAGGWAPRFSFRSGYIPTRDIVARVSFSVKNEQKEEQPYEPGDVLAKANHALSTSDIQVLRSEHDAFQLREEERAPWKFLERLTATFTVYLGLFLFAGSYLVYHRSPLVRDVRRLMTALGAVVATLAAAIFLSRDAWRAESIPLLLLGTTFAIAYNREIAALLAVCTTIVVAVALGQSLPEVVIHGAAILGSIIMLNRVRSRTKLIYVGLLGGLVAFVACLGVGVLVHQAFGLAEATRITTTGETMNLSPTAFHMRLVSGASWYAACAALAGFLTTGLLPFIERLFDVQTDISLLELGDAAHPLLQQLAHRAPGTYNHSISVASIAETAAESIGANGLLVRVGTYFHDIGKMLQPVYFIENQGDTGNQHESLVPAMSTLVIIAHVKDGADLARQHRLPKSVIDFIEQHHGTTLVEYFYRRAEKQREVDPDGGAVEERSFRYPGPKPQTKENAVLMIADAVEGACRTLVEPTPARIESLVHELAMKRLLDGQFEECDLTLRELNKIEDSLIKSLTAVYHGRIKYPDQNTA